MVLPIIQRTTSTTGTENEKNPLIELGIQSHSLFLKILSDSCACPIFGTLLYGICNSVLTFIFIV